MLDLWRWMLRCEHLKIIVLWETVNIKYKYLKCKIICTHCIQVGFCDFKWPSLVIFAKNPFSLATLGTFHFFLVSFYQVTQKQDYSRHAFAWKVKHTLTLSSSGQCWVLCSQTYLFWCMPTGVLLSIPVLLCSVSHSLKGRGWSVTSTKYLEILAAGLNLKRI